MLFKIDIYDASAGSLEQFKSSREINFIADTYEQQLGELFLIQNPRFRFIPEHSEELKVFLAQHSAGKPLEACGTWVYFPWNRSLVHYLPDDLHQQLRTARNKNLITADEQRIFYDATVTVAGLSVGSYAAMSIIMTGGAKNIKLADFDDISGSNLNRILAKVADIGTNKAVYIARHIAEANPYANIFVYTEGVTAENLDQLVTGGKDADGVEVPASKIMVEQIDGLEMKIRLRLAAKASKIALIMATDVGEGGILDVERHDTDPTTELFNGLAGPINVEEFRSFPPQQMLQLVTRIIGAENMPQRVQESMLAIGKSIYSWPQLGSAAAYSGAVLAYVTRRIALGANIKSGRYSLAPEKIIEADLNTPEALAADAKRTAEFKAAIGL